MNNVAPSDSGFGRLFFRSLKLAGALLILWLAFALFAAELEPVLHFVFGWIFAGGRLTQSFQGSVVLVWWSIGFGVFVLGLHYYVRVMRRTTPRFRATVAVVGLVWLALIAGMSLAGSVHQLGWLMTSPEPWIRKSGRMAAASQIHEAAQFARQILQDTSNAERWTQAWQNGENFRTSEGHTAPELFAVHIVAEGDGDVHSVFIWPRNGEQFRIGGGVWFEPGEQQQYMSKEGFMAAMRAASAAPKVP